MGYLYNYEADQKVCLRVILRAYISISKHKMPITGKKVPGTRINPLLNYMVLQVTGK